MRRLSLFFLFLLLASPQASVAAPVPVTSCGQTIFEGVLVGDLDCSGAAGVALRIADGGSIDLAGFTLTSPAIPGWSLSGIECLRNCTITGHGGSIVPATPYEYDVSMPTAISLPYPRRGRVAISDTTISGYQMVATAFDLDVANCTLVDNFSGLFARRSLNIAGTTITNPEQWGHQSASARHVRITDSVLQGGGGITSRRVELIRTSIGGMHDFGVQATGTRQVLRLNAEDSEILGNCASASSEICADILSTRKKPVLVNSVCGTSRRHNGITKEFTTWGICIHD